MLVKLMPQLAKLLQGFLDAEDYRLSNDEIIRLLWPKNDGTADKLHQNIKRLRGCLSQISTTTIESENSTYRLKIPISSGEIPPEIVFHGGLTKADNTDFTRLSVFVSLAIGRLLGFSTTFGNITSNYIGYGTVDCPISDVKVYFLAGPYNLEKRY